MQPLIKIARGIDSMNDGIGKTVAWMATFMVVIQFFVVMLRYVFGYNLIFIQDSIIYMHSFIFLLGAGYTLLHDGHVRVDIFYREAALKRKAMTDLFGIFVFLVPVCISILWYGIPYAADSWVILENAREGSGIHLYFVLKSAIPAFAALVLLQGLAMAVHCVLRIMGLEEAPPEEEHEPL